MRIDANAKLDHQETNSETTFTDLFGQRISGKMVFSGPRAEEICTDGCEGHHPDQWRIAPAEDFEIAFRHSCWQAQRMQTATAMEAIEVPPARLERFRNCGALASVYRAAGTDDLTVRSSTCRDRFCRICGNERSSVIQQNLLHHIIDRQVRFVTLTLRHNSEPIEAQLTRLMTSWNRLRERKFFRSCMSGGAVFTEIKLDKTGRFWHPHLHIIVEGSYINSGILSTEWHAVTGDSYIVDVRAVDSVEKAAAYIAKYASKPLDATLYRDPSRLAQAMAALRGKRLCSTFGTWRGFALEAHPVDEREWIFVGTLRQIRSAATDGSEADRALCVRLGIQWSSREAFDVEDLE